MLEIFIPIFIRSKKLIINKISKKFLLILQKSFENIKIEKIEKIEKDDFFGFYIFLEKFDYDLIKVLNGECREFYFLDYDKIENRNVFSFGVSFSKFDEIEKNILKQGKTIEKIKNILSSDKLLTNSKKEEIKRELQKIFFTLSGILFVLYKNKNSLEKNHKFLKTYDGLEEYKAQAKLFLETTKTKKLELQKNIEKFENMSKLYLDILEKLFILN